MDIIVLGCISLFITGLFFGYFLGLIGGLGNGKQK
jgi:hypothetical protein